MSMIAMMPPASVAPDASQVMQHRLDDSFINSFAYSLYPAV